MLSDTSCKPSAVFQILVLIYGFLFRVCWILFRIVKDLDYGLKMFLSKSTILSLVWTVLNVAVYTHWMTISWMFITCFTWLKVCSMDTMIGTQTNYPFLVTNGEEKENARLLIYQGILHYVIVMTTTVGYGDMYSTTYYEMILTILMSIGSKMFYSNVMGDMSSLFTFNINSKNNFMQMTKRLKEEMQHLPFPRSDTEGKDKLTMDDVKNAKDIDDKMALNELVDTELKEDTPQKIERYCILGYNFSNGYVIDDLFNDTPLLMNAEEKRDMYRAFLIQVMKFPTLSEKLLEVKNIAQQKADAAGVIDEKGKRKREKDLVLAIQRQVALRVQEHSLMVTQDFVIKNRIRDGSKAAQPHIYAMAKRGAFSKVMGKVKKGRHRQQTENEEGEVLREERVRNKTWKVEVPANEILGPGDYVVKTTCLALVLVHDDAFAVLNKYEALVKGEDEE
ncbi:uncharacterized protein LOC134841854 [Symsagittifera roscoffensis]|uniref:uncharacterized protein LOC134841854 n=1 Tax=Symsagittifera roscoffensis TaxID=84072 RepID=UPI00307C40FD